MPIPEERRERLRIEGRSKYLVYFPVAKPQIEVACLCCGENTFGHLFCDRRHFFMKFFASLSWMERPSFVCHEIRPPKGGLLQGFFNSGFPAEHPSVSWITTFDQIEKSQSADTWHLFCSFGNNFFPPVKVQVVITGLFFRGNARFHEFYYFLKWFVDTFTALCRICLL